MITIAIPSYNQRDYLMDAIESAVEQKGDREILVIDDGSTDGSYELAKQYEPEVRVIRQVNKGLASARNTAIMNMKGEYLLPLDADDILMDGALEKIQAKIDETNADIIGLSFKEFGVRDTLIILQKASIKEFYQANRIGYCSAIKKERLLECGGYSPKMTWGYEDYHLWFDLLSRGASLEVIQEPVWLYRVKPNSMIHSAQEHHAELMQQIYKDFPI